MGRWSTATAGAAPNWGSRRPTWPSPTRSPCRPTRVYAGHFHRADGTLHQAAISVGRRPTFYEPGTAPVLVEAYLLHFDDDLYGEPARVSFAHRLRSEQRFESIEALVAQMRADVEATERVLASADLP